ncbi:LysR family transcriptional regulator [Streptomyces bathyalis]|uniref:LysR family transcriptional regulator n=1 Tax=Streptomyces bathyalis TaxID=2710756 RepID=A0A7T1T2J9_9ACTN|nr:LysR family transcriptional regulator [Streptomyces bathyalis]QPP05210.1 LysR family transcriptional regulator [Streptomyces bathyalis]
MDDDRIPQNSMGELLDPRRMLVFAEVARTGSLAAAAHLLGWTQPAVAQHVRRLEREAGCPLVVRNSRGVTLTEAGQSLATHAEALVVRLRAARADLDALNDLRAGRVRLAAFPSACATVVPAALALLHERTPGLDVRLTEAAPSEARRLLAAGDIDLAVTFDYDNVPVNASDERAIPLFDDPIRLVVPIGHPLAEHPEADLADARDQRWIAGCPSCLAHLRTAAAGCGFLPDVRHSTDDYVVTQTLVSTGLGVALLPALALEAARDPAVTAIGIRAHSPRRIALIGSADVPQSRATTAVSSAIRTVTEHRL